MSLKLIVFYLEQPDVRLDAADVVENALLVVVEVEPPRHLVVVSGRLLGPLRDQEEVLKHNAA